MNIGDKVKWKESLIGEVSGIVIGIATCPALVGTVKCVIAECPSHRHFIGRKSRVPVKNIL